MEVSNMAVEQSVNVNLDKHKSKDIFDRSWKVNEEKIITELLQLKCRGLKITKRLVFLKWQIE